MSPTKAHYLNHFPLYYRFSILTPSAGVKLTSDQPSWSLRTIKLDKQVGFPRYWPLVAWSLSSFPFVFPLMEDSSQLLLVESNFRWGMRDRSCDWITFSSLLGLSLPSFAVRALRSRSRRLLLWSLCPFASPPRDAADVILCCHHTHAHDQGRAQPPRARRDKESSHTFVCAHRPFQFTRKPL